MFATVALAAAAILGQPESCSTHMSGPAVLTTVHGFRDRRGRLRIVIYRANDEELLASGKYVQRIDTEMTASGEMTVCAPVAEPGDYVVVALHDRDSNGRLSPFSDGVGFSRNPTLKLSKPKAASTAIRIEGVTPLRIELNYLKGLRPRPWREQQSR